MASAKETLMWLDPKTKYSSFSIVTIIIEFTAYDCVLCLYKIKQTMNLDKSYVRYNYSFSYA